MPMGSIDAVVALCGEIGILIRHLEDVLEQRAQVNVVDRHVLDKWSYEKIK